MARLTVVTVALGVSLACGGDGPPDDVVSAGRAVQAWRAGYSALEKGHGVEAAAAFAEARAVRPDDGLLAAWEARAWLERGELEKAGEALDAAIAKAPELGGARYLRARLRASSDPEGAVEDLAAALRAKTVTRHQARRDPALAPLVGHPAASFLPADPLGVTVEVPTESVFRGSEVEIRLTVQGLVPERPLGLSLGVDGPVSLARVEVREVADMTGEPGRAWTWTLHVDGGGPVRIRVGEVSHDGATLPIPGGAFDALGDPAPSRSLTLPDPRRIHGAHPVPSVWEDGGRRWVAMPGEARLTSPRPSPRPWRISGPEGEVLLVPLPLAGGPVVVSVGGRPVLEEGAAGDERQDGR